MLEAGFVDIFENTNYIAFPNSIRIILLSQFQRYTEQNLIRHALSDIPTRIHIVHCHSPQTRIRMKVFGVCQNILIPRSYAGTEKK